MLFSLSKSPLMSKKITLDIGYVEIHEHFAVGVLNEGIDLKTEENKYLLNVFRTEYQSKPFGFISNRVHSYSVDPTVYKETSELKNLMAIAVVISSPVQKLSIEIEKLFFNKPFEYFSSLEEAKAWMQNTIEHRINTTE